MIYPLSILSFTCDEFCRSIYDHFGKGWQHAEKVYKALYQKNDLNLAKNEMEPQAYGLINEISKLIELPHFEMVNLKEEGTTKKFLLKLKDALVTETVCIPMKFGNTLCISSQVGCKMGCAFCETGKMGLLRNLTPSEIIAQVFFARHILQLDIRNIVFMGMGEPFDNFDSVMRAIKILTDPKGLCFGPSRITVSTSGIVPMIYRFAEEADPAINLAVSVNAPSNQIRKKIMAVNKVHDMDALKKAMLHYCLNRRREILVEYVLLQDINDSLESAQMLLDYLVGLRVKINLIPYNPQSKDRFSPPSPEVCDAFLCYLRGKGAKALLRTTKGQNIMAACGQLGNLLLRQQYLKSKISLI